MFFVSNKKWQSYYHNQNLKCCRDKIISMLSNYSSIPSCPYYICASSRVFRTGTGNDLGAQMAEIAPSPSSKLKSQNLLAFGYFFSIVPPLSSKCERYYFQPRPEVPIVIGQKMFYSDTVFQYHHRYPRWCHCYQLSPLSITNRARLKP